MAQASGKSGHYRYYKCTTRLIKGISRYDSGNLPRKSTDALVLTALPQRVFTPARVKLMLQERKKRRRAARTVEDTRLLALRKELDKAIKTLSRPYEAVEVENPRQLHTAGRCLHSPGKKRSWAFRPASYVIGAPGRI